MGPGLGRDDRIRVALVTHYFSTHRGGVEQVAGQLATRLASGKCSVTWLASDTDPLPETSHGVTAVPVGALNPLERFGFPWPIWRPAGLGALRRAIDAADIVHVHDFIYFGSLVAFVLARRARKPFIVTQHIGDISFDSPILRSLIRIINRTVGRFVLGRADQVVFVSESVRAHFLGYVSFARPPLHIPNGVDTSVFHPVDADARARLRAALGMSHTDKAVLYAGRFVEKKGLPFLRLLAAALPRYRWWLAGWGSRDATSHPDRWALPHVRVFGERSGTTLAELYCAADLLVLASMSESGSPPLVVQEAIACGTQVLVAAAIAAGSPEAAPVLLAAPIQPVNDAVAAWTAAIAKAVAQSDDPKLREELAAFARTNWAWERTAARYIELFNAVGRGTQLLDRL